MTRKDALAYICIAGYHDDRKAFTRLLIENRVSRKAADEAWLSGRKARENGVKCSCHHCKSASSG